LTSAGTFLKGCLDERALWAAHWKSTVAAKSRPARRDLFMVPVYSAPERWRWTVAVAVAVVRCEEMSKC